MSVDTRIIERIKKLLALAESDNESEAKLAMDRANEMLVRYNLSSSQVLSGGDMQTFTMDGEFQFAPMEDKFILTILERHFFVKCLYNRIDTGRFTSAGHRVVMQNLLLIGTPMNVEIAVYVYGYLMVNFRSLWKKYKHATDSTERSRQAYYVGLFNGINEKLAGTRQKVEQETGLVWVGDKAISDYVKKSYGKTDTKKKSKVHHDSEATEAGIKDGNGLDIRAGLKKSESQQSGKMLK